MTDTAPSLIEGQKNLTTKEKLTQFAGDVRTRVGKLFAGVDLNPDVSKENMRAEVEDHRVSITSILHSQPGLKRVDATSWAKEEAVAAEVHRVLPIDSSNTLPEASMLHIKDSYMLYGDGIKLNVVSMPGKDDVIAVDGKTLLNIDDLTDEQKNKISDSFGIKF